MTTVGEILLSSLLLVIAGFCLRTALRLLYGARGPTPDDVVHLLLRVLSWTLIIAPGVVLMILSTNWLFVLLLGFALQALVETVLARREMQRRAVWHVTASAMRNGAQSAPDVLRMHQRRFTGVVGRAFRKLVRDVDQGVPWQIAIPDNAKAFPREAPAYAALVGGAEEAPMAEPSDDDIHVGALAENWRQIIHRLSYFATVAFVMLGILIFMMIKIVPSFYAIFQDFEMELPAMTVALIAMAEAINWFGIPLSLMVMFTVATVLAIGVLYLMDWPVLRWLTDRLLISRHRSEVLRLLAVATERRLPFQETLAGLASSARGYPSRYVRRKLAAASDAVAAGVDWPVALKRQRIISSAEVGILQAAQQAGNLPWALRIVAGQKLRRMAFWLTLVQNVLFTAVVLLIGFIVLFVAVALMVPLAKLINGLS